MQRMTTAAGLLILLLCAMPAQAILPLVQPAGTGSQLIFYYDTRPGFTTFVNVRSSFSSNDLQVRLDFWGPTFQTKVTQTFELPFGGGRVIDAGGLKTSLGLGAQQGIAFATIVDASGNPLHFGRSMMGNFTVANLATGSAWGAPALARSARVAADGSEPPDGTVVDGTTVAYQQIVPTEYSLGTYYDPQSLAPVADHGNQLIFVNFTDPTTVGSPVTSGTSTWSVVATQDTDGQLVSSAPITVSGVSEFDVVSLFGDRANGSPGGVGFFNGNQSGGVSRLIFFVQSLGTFGTGYLLPGG